MFILGYDYLAAVTLCLYDWNNTQMAVLIYKVLKKRIEEDEELLGQIKDIFTNYFKKYSKITQIIISIIFEDYNTSKDYLINY